MMAISRVNPSGDWRHSAVEHLRIVPKDCFESVQHRLEARSYAQASGAYTRKAKRQFSGILKCGVCGGGMSVHDRKGSAIRIRCSTERESGSCPNTGYYRLDRIEQAVIGHLAHQLARPGYAEAYVRAYREEREAETAAARRDRTKLEREVGAAKSACDRLIHLYTSGVIDGADAETRIIQARERVRIAEAEMAKAEEATNVIELHPDAARLFSRSVAALIAALENPEPSIDPGVLAAIRLLITQIVIEPDGKGDMMVEVQGSIADLMDPYSQVGERW